MQIFKDKNGKIVITQKPNLPIILAAIVWAISKITSGNVSEFFAASTSVLLIYWAFLEMFWGVNLFRRLLGGVVMLVSINSLF